MTQCVRKVARTAIKRAVIAEPDDPSIPLAATWLALEDRMPDRAMVHVHAGLARDLIAGGSC